MSESSKVQPHHLGRGAYLYIRQSSPRQVLENVESGKRQYALRGRAVALGWRDAGRAVRLQVRADAALAPGACVCETDLGAVDASLSLQLAAMRGALTRAVQSVPDAYRAEPAPPDAFAEDAYSDGLERESEFVDEFDASEAAAHAG